MPGPVSDSYDPEFGTGERADIVRKAVEIVRDEVTQLIGSAELKDIVEISATIRAGGSHALSRELSEYEWRVIRFALNRALESL